MSAATYLLEYRVPISAALLVLCLASMFILTSQSGSSFPTYVLALYALAGCKRWAGLWLNWTFLLTVAIALYLAVSSFWSAPFDARGALSQFIRAVLTVCFVVAVAEGFRVDWFRARLTATVALCAGGAAALALAVYFIEVPADGRVNGMGQLDSHVPAALTFGVGLVCAIGWALDARSVALRAFVVALALCAVLAIALSGSRNAWAAVSFGCVVCLLGRWVPNRRHFIAAVALAASVALGIGLALMQGPLQEWLLPRGDSYRLEIWTETLRRVSAAGPWFGNGALTEDDILAHDGFVMQHPHNMYLSVLFQGGAVGLAALVALIAASLAALFKHFEAAQAKLALSIYAITLPAWLVDGADLIDKIGWTWMLFWLPVAISVGLAARHGLADARRFSGG